MEEKKQETNEVILEVHDSFLMGNNDLEKTDNQEDSNHGNVVKQ